MQETTSAADLTQALVNRGLVDPQRINKLSPDRMQKLREMIDVGLEALEAPTLWSPLDGTPKLVFKGRVISKKALIRSSIAELGFVGKIDSSLQRMRINTIGQLLALEGFDTLARGSFLGDTSKMHISETLTRHGLRFAHTDASTRVGIVTTEKVGLVPACLKLAAVFYSMDRIVLSTAERKIPCSSLGVRFIHQVSNFTTTQVRDALEDALEGSCYTADELQLLHSQVLSMAAFAEIW